MTGHVHLLVMPEAADGVPRMMQVIGRRYVGTYNTRYRSRGPVRRPIQIRIDGHRQLNAHLLPAIELNPVRTETVADPSGYPWSSYRRNALGAHHLGISPTPTT